MLHQLRSQLLAHGSKEKAAFFPKFFKTGKGEYGEGDVFIGVTVPQIRLAVKAFSAMPLSDVLSLITDPVHEYRLAGFLILVRKFERGTDGEKKNIVRFYLKHMDCANNWDLVDSSAPKILGAFLYGKKDTSTLETLALSGRLWRQRIAIVSTQFFIRHGDVRPTMRIAKILLQHPHDLIHKAVGWMLREAGKKDDAALRKFLNTHAATMPRTMLRYALEKFDPATKNRYMQHKAVHLTPR